VTEPTLDSQLLFIDHIDEALVARCILALYTLCLLGLGSFCGIGVERHSTIIVVDVNGRRPLSETRVLVFLLLPGLDQSRRITTWFAACAP
jgi:hypothetical protein